MVAQRHLNQHLLESKDLTLKQKTELENQYNLLNPITLKREMSQKLSQFSKFIKQTKEYRESLIA